ncbi:GM11684 [Drosophila sechellia]|uniref:GM11684 n=1 Tax=Drosophila sechellia TaxID=7238 RepID=B4IMD4_DROSE|nr:GM11684 [Drosophila sechellia]
MPQPAVSLYGKSMLATLADDVCVTYRSRCEHDAADGIQDFAYRFSEWARRWNIGINSSKSNNICFTLKRRTPPPVYIEEAPVPQPNAAKYLGVLLDRRLTFSKHVTDIRTRLRAKVAKHYWLLCSRTWALGPSHHDRRRNAHHQRCNDKYHFDPVTMIDEGMLITNDVTINITDEREISRIILGTHLVSYTEKIKINGTLYVNNIGTSKKKAGVSAMAQVNVLRHLERLNLSSIHGMSVKNLQHINHLQSRLPSGNTWIFCSVSSTASITLVIFLIYRLKAKRQQPSKTMESGDEFILRPGEVNTSSQACAR